MIGLLMDKIWNMLLDITGSDVLNSLLFMALFLFVFLIFGLDFDFALLLLTPLPYAFYEQGYLELWVAGVFIVIVLGFSIYMIWERWKNKM